MGLPCLRRYAVADLVSNVGRTEKILDHIRRITAGDLGVRTEPSDSLDQLDAVIVALNMLSEDLREREEASIKAEAEHLVLKEHSAKLEREKAALEEFAYVASHDLREPLRMVTTYTELLRTDYEGVLGTKGNQYAEFALDGACQLRQLVEDLLSFSSISAESLSFSATDTGSLVDSVVVELKEQIEKAGATVTCGALPTVRADAERLWCVFENLISNAIKYRSARLPEVRIGACHRAGDWLFSVADNGIGIEPVYFDRIFRVFARMHHPKEYEGTGIGLATCRRVVQAHGGQIWVSSSLGRGACFRFTLPASKVTTSPSLSLPPSRDRTSR